MHIINSESSLQACIGDMREDFHKHKYLKVDWKVGSSRSDSQNKISHVWYEQVARELREDDALGWKCFSKLHYGVPILAVEDEQFRAFYNAALRNLTYEQKLAAMKFVPVTSEMTKPQLSKYLEAMQAGFQEQGVKLDFPRED